jgi:galactosylceramidase
MALASSPWSGNYTLCPELWAHAHTCQFTKIGWKFLDGEGCGYFKDKGSYVTYKSPDGSDYSIVLETKGAKASQRITFKISGGLSQNKVSVWHSDEKNLFEKESEITPQDGMITITLAPDSIYTLTTTAGQHKGAHPAPPAESPFPFPYYENYDHYRSTGVLPYYHSDIHGIFEVVARPDGQGQCARGVIPFNKKGVPVDGFTIMGDAGWKDYEVSVDACPDGDGNGAAVLMGRISWTRATSTPKGYLLHLSKDGSWELFAAQEKLASGKAALAAHPWHNMKLVFEGANIKAIIDQTQVAAVTSNTFAAGMAGLGTVTSTPYFDNLIVNKIGGAPPEPTVFFQDEINTKK